MHEAAPTQPMDTTMVQETAIEGYGFQRQIIHRTTPHTDLYVAEIHALNNRLAQVQQIATNELGAYERENQRITHLAETEINPQRNEFQQAVVNHREQRG